MKFTVTHTRAFSGNDLGVLVECAPGESLRSASVMLDESALEELQLPTGTVSLQRSYSKVGSASPGCDHTLQVSVWTEEDKPLVSVTVWTDLS